MKMIRINILLLILVNLFGSLFVVFAKDNSTEIEDKNGYDYKEVLNRHKRQCACLSQYTPVNCKCTQADPSNSNDLACRCDKATVSPQCSCAPAASTLCFPVCQQQCIQSCVAQQQSLPQCQPPCQLICQRACQTLPQSPVYATLQPIQVNGQSSQSQLPHAPLPVAPNQQIIYAIPQSQNQLPQPISHPHPPSPQSSNAQSIGQAAVFLPTQAQCIPLCTEQCMKNCPNSPGQCAQTCTNGCHAACSRQPSQFWAPTQHHNHNQQDIVFDCAQRCEPSCHRACAKLPNQHQPTVCLPACVNMCQSNCQVNQPDPLPPSQYEGPNHGGCTPLCRPDCSPKCVRQFVEPSVSNNLVLAQVGNRETAANLRRTPQEFVVQASPNDFDPAPNMRTIFESEYFIPLDGNTKDIVIPIQLPQQQTLQIALQPPPRAAIPLINEIPYGASPAYPPYYHPSQVQSDLYYQLAAESNNNSKIYEVSPSKEEQPSNQTLQSGDTTMNVMEKMDDGGNRMQAAPTNTAISPIQFNYGQQLLQNQSPYQSIEQVNYQQNAGQSYPTISQLAEYYQKLNQQLIAYQTSELNKSNSQIPYQPSNPQVSYQVNSQPSGQMESNKNLPQIPYQPPNPQVSYQVNSQPAGQVQESNKNLPQQSHYQPVPESNKFNYQSSNQLPQFVSQTDSQQPINYPQFSPTIQANPPAYPQQKIDQSMPNLNSQQYSANPPIYPQQKMDKPVPISNNQQYPINLPVYPQQKIDKSLPNSNNQQNAKSISTNKLPNSNPIPYAQQVENPVGKTTEKPKIQVNSDANQGIITSQPSPPGLILQNSYSPQSNQQIYASPYYPVQNQRPINTWQQQPILPQPTYRTLVHHQRHQPKPYSQIGDQKYQQSPRLYNQKEPKQQSGMYSNLGQQVRQDLETKKAFTSQNDQKLHLQPPSTKQQSRQFDPTAPLNDADTLSPGEISLNIDFPNPLNGPQISDVDFQKSCSPNCQPNCHLNCVQQYKNGIRVGAKEAQSFFRRRYSKLRNPRVDKKDFDRWENLKGGEDMKNLTRGDGNLQTLKFGRPVGGSGRVYRTNGRENCEESCRRVCSRACETHRDNSNDYKCSNKCEDECSQRCPNFKVRK